MDKLDIEWGEYSFTLNEAKDRYLRSLDFTFNGHLLKVREALPPTEEAKKEYDNLKELKQTILNLPKERWIEYL